MLLLEHQGFEDDVMRTFHRNQYSLSIWKNAAGVIWLRARVTVRGGRITEYLVCEDIKEGIFRIVNREAKDWAIPMTIVVRRNNLFPVNSKVKLKV